MEVPSSGVTLVADLGGQADHGTRPRCGRRPGTDGASRDETREVGRRSRGRGAVVGRDVLRICDGFATHVGRGEYLRSGSNVVLFTLAASVARGPRPRP